MTVQIAPWLSVANAAHAVAYYQAAFGAEIVERVDGDDGELMIAQLAFAGATCWVQADGDANPIALGGRSPARMVLLVDDPDAWLARALAAGATEVAAVQDAHGWRVGRVVDPSGHHWECARRL